MTTRGRLLGCIEVYASCVKAAVYLLTTRGRLLGCIEVYASSVKAAFYLLTSFKSSIHHLVN